MGMDNGKLPLHIISPKVASLFDAATKSGVKWDSATAADAKNELKNVLLENQNGKCAYCRRMITDEPGHVEIDHILPKSSHGKAGSWTSNDAGQRRATAGYAQFTFVPYNLALTCKRCNNQKGTYDSRKNRMARAHENYVLRDDYYQWVHIYLHNYSDHIQILHGLIYHVVDKSAGGDAVISVCKLDKIAAAEKAAAERRAKNMASVSKAICILLHHVEIAGWDFVFEIVVTQFPNIPKEKVEETIEMYKRLYI